jgi:hypothetical protein
MYANANQRAVCEVVLTTCVRLLVKEEKGKSGSVVTGAKEI